MKMFAVKYGEEYLKFRSRGEVTVYTTPIRASLYSSARLAKARIAPIMINGIVVNDQLLQVVEITFDIASETVVP